MEKRGKRGSNPSSIQSTKVMRYVLRRSPRLYVRDRRRRSESEAIHVELGGDVSPVALHVVIVTTIAYGLPSEIEYNAVRYQNVGNPFVSDQVRRGGVNSLSVMLSSRGDLR